MVYRLRRRWKDGTRAVVFAPTVHEIVGAFERAVKLRRGEAPA